MEMGRTESAIHKALKRIHEVLRACIESGLAQRRTAP